MNPQIKHIRILCCSNVDGNIFQSIATHVVHIETIQMSRVEELINDVVYIKDGYIDIGIHLRYYFKSF